MAAAVDYGLSADIELAYSGKVRDMFRMPDGRLLMVASDRISAFDWILPTTIPDKGRILTALSHWWFDRIGDIVPNHRSTAAVPEAVRGRAMIVESLDMLPIECVVRGYLAGSALAEYRDHRSICGVGLPPGLKDGSLLPKPIFTPATKAAVGDHDVNITFDEAIVLVGQEEAQQLRRLSLAIYERANAICQERGLILADTKLEFGLRRSGRTAGTIVLGDEVLTPDSSRFWPVQTWEPGLAQPSFDKQYVRDWLLSAESGWDRDSGMPPPPLPADVVAATRERYLDAYRVITGGELA